MDRERRTLLVPTLAGWTAAREDDPTVTEKVVLSDEEKRQAIASAQRQAVDMRKSFSPQALLELKAEAFALWLVTYMPHHVPEIDDWQVASLEDLVEYNRTLLMWPAGMGKTTLGACLYPLWRVLGDRDIEVLGVLKDDNEAKGALKLIRDEMEMNERLIEDYGQMKPHRSQRQYKWTEHKVDIFGRERRSKQSSFMYFAYGSKILGQRSHLRFVDDIVTRQIAFSPNETRKQIEYFKVDFETGPYSPEDKSGYKPNADQMWVCATRMAPKDLLNHIETRLDHVDQTSGNEWAGELRPYHVHVIDLIKNEEKHETISKRWPWRKAMAKRAEMGEREFGMRFRNLIITEATAIFKRVYFDGGKLAGMDIEYPGCWDNTLTMEDCIEKGFSVVIGHDPQSGSESRDSADAAMVMLANRTGEWKPRLCDFVKGQMEVVSERDEDTHSQVAHILRMSRACNRLNIIPTVIMEGNATQRAFRAALMNAASNKNVQLRCKIDFTGVNRHDPETGVEATAVDFENGWLRIPRRYPSDEAHFLPFVKAMNEYGTSKFYDVPMAYWMARSYLFMLRGTAQEAVVIVNAHLAAYPPWLTQRLKRRGQLGALRIRDPYTEQLEETGHELRV